MGLHRICVIYIDDHQWVEESEARRNTLRQQCQDIPNDEMLPFGRSTYGLEFHMDKVLDSLDEVELFERVSCSICGDVPLTPMQTDVSVMSLR